MNTLNTTIFVQGEVGVWELFNTTLFQVIFFDGRNAAPADIELIQDAERGLEVITPDEDEKLPMRFALWYKNGADAFTAEEAAARHSSSCTSAECRAHGMPACHIVLGMGTSILHSDDRGWNAGHLHAAMLWHIGDFLDKKKVPWKWHENFSNTVHDGYEDMDNLALAVENAKSQILNPQPQFSQEILRRLGFMNGYDK